MSVNVTFINKKLFKTLKEQINHSDTIYILTSFAMKSGVSLLEAPLKEAAERGADIKILTGDYLCITQPDALEMLSNIHPTIQVRLWRSNGTSFHPKAYMFGVGEADEGMFIVGSSNMSYSAMSEGIEWNLAVDGEGAKQSFNEVTKEFMNLYLSENTVSINQETIKKYRKTYEKYHETNRNLSQKWSEAEEISLTIGDEKEDASQLIAQPTQTYGQVIPRFAQIDALRELDATLEEGYDKAMVVMATGLGKTYLAAFFAQKFKRVLFIAHLEEILYQAAKSFTIVNPDKKTGIYNGTVKDGDAEYVFASIYTLSQERHLHKFHPEEFDLIIVDEFHHAAANSYQRVLQYFNPTFLLGITATPDRNDNKDVFAICDGNVAYSIHFLEAIQSGWLSTFRYFGVYDDTDYSQIKWLGTKYDQDELLVAQLKESVAQNILEAWGKHKQTRTIGFCSSIKQAQYLSNYFNEHGYKTITLHSQEGSFNRKDGIQLLKNGEIDVIFTVNLFNEGVDIPEVDTLLFARPTESLTVFTQQFGRGLRLHPDKEVCVIIDLIGNYRHADIKQSLFFVGDTESKKKSSKPILPTGCTVDYDLNVINIFNEFKKKKYTRREQLISNYDEVKEQLGRIPTYLELHRMGALDSRMYKQESGTYFAFLEEIHELSEEEIEVLESYREWFLEVERTSMVKSYKMVVLNAMLNRGEENWYKAITPHDVAPFFFTYLTEKEYRRRVDFNDKTTKALSLSSMNKVEKLVAQMPMTKWSGSSNGLITFEDDEFKLLLNVKPEHQQILFNWTKEINDYRLHSYFERRGK